MMFITKKKLERLLAQEREKMMHEHHKEDVIRDTRMEMERMERNLWERMNDLERRLDQRIDKLAELTLPEEKKHTCPLCPPVRI